MVLLILSVTFASYDWIMSLEPHWFSSIFGVLVGIGLVVSAFAFAIVVITRLRHRAPLAEVTGAPIFNDLGSLMLAFVMIWAYIQLSQYLIIWSANIPEEATWYLHRSTHGWEWVAIGLILFHFVIPFVLLMARRIRANPQTLARLALFLLVMHFVDMFWLVKPTFAPEGVSIHWLDLVALIGVGGIWVALFFWEFKKHPLVPPQNIPELRERLEHAHG